MVKVIKDASGLTMQCQLEGRGQKEGKLDKYVEGTHDLGQHVTDMVQLLISGEDLTRC